MNECARVCAIVFLIIFVIIIIQYMPCSSNADDTDFTPLSSVHNIDMPLSDMKPPNDGPSIVIDDENPNKSPANDPCIRGAQVTPLAKGGMSLATRKWYSEIYDGGAPTEVPVMDKDMETAMLYKHDFISNSSKGFDTWEKFKSGMRGAGLPSQFSKKSKRTR